MSTSAGGEQPIIKHGPHKWQAVTPSGEKSLLYYSRHQAWDWLLRHSCDHFEPWTDKYVDLCQNCGGHSTTHGPATSTTPQN